MQCFALSPLLVHLFQNNDVGVSAEWLLCTPPEQIQMATRRINALRSPSSGRQAARQPQSTGDFMPEFDEIPGPIDQAPPPDSLVQQLMDIMETRDEALAVDALMQNVWCPARAEQMS